MLALRIALRYLFAPKSHRAVNVISLISMSGVAVAAMAIVIVLSVFNGFSHLAERHLSMMDPDLRIRPAQGKVFGSADSIAADIASTEGIAAAMPVLEERALLVSGKHQMPVIFKGIDHSVAPSIIAVDSLIIDGIFAPASPLTDSLAAAQVSVGVALHTGLRPSPYAAAELYVPRRKGRINPANPAAAYRGINVAVTGVFQVDQPDYDADRLLLPLAEARRLLDYTSEASTIEVAVDRGADIAKVEKMLQTRLGSDFIVEDRLHQQYDTFRMIAVEKWVTFAMLVFVLLIACFNIITTLSLLVIEKRDNMSTLRALGASRRFISRIFITEGWLITAVGGLAGTAVGVLLALAQQHFGLIRLDGDPAALTTDVYPVRVDAADIAAVTLVIILTGLAIAQLARLFTRKDFQ